MLYQPFGRNGKSINDLLTIDMKLKQSLLLFSFIGVLGLAFFLTPFKGFNNEPDPKKEAALMRSVLQHLSGVHFQPKSIDDEFSKSLFHLYLKNIDNSKRFLNQSDIDQLMVFETQLDDQANAGTFEFFNLSVSLLENSLVKTQGWYQEILSKPLDFSSDDFLQADGKKLDWAKDDAELRQRWEKWMKYEILNRISDEQAKQEKEDFTGEKKDFATLETEQREKVLDLYDKWFKRMSKMDRSRRMEIFFNSFTNVFDPHSGYFSPIERQNFDIQMSGKLEGIGARLQSDGEKTTVTEIVPGGPAWKQGALQANDVILKVAQGDTDKESMDIMGWDIDDVVSKIRGDKGTKVTLTVQKPDGSEKVIVITRDVVIMEEGFAKSLILTSSGHEKDKIGYIFLPKFYADFTSSGVTSCAADVQKEVNKLKSEQVKGIILDLRGNGGGSLRDVIQMSGLFIEEGPIVQVKGRRKSPEIMNDNDPRVQWGGPLIVMVNGFSASASEILAAAMQDYGRAVIVGSAGTYGKGTVQRFYDLDNIVSDESVKPLGSMKLTMQKFYRVTGKTTQLDGVTPDIVLPDFYNYIDNGERDTDFPLESTTIEAVPFNQTAYHISDLDKLKSNSAARVSADPIFQKVNDNASRLRKLKDQTSYPLELYKFKKWNTKMDEEAKRYDDIFTPIETLQIENLAVDMPQIQSDTSRQARNESWLKDRQKDIQLFETVQIMNDMLRMDAMVGKH